ncbi:hypothetical protein FH972_010611 [Carpinus fangiana]|uniref:Uncharacterized protein n=1 Tax=Carpinus fangiana TaxID=176857 RepID=A0A660KRZ4_9ROSI|nr:hypothetical protein FH972_010611 [Carpinus fangiana]
MKHDGDEDRNDIHQHKKVRWSWVSVEGHDSSLSLAQLEKESTLSQKYPCRIIKLQVVPTVETQGTTDSVQFLSDVNKQFVLCLAFWKYVCAWGSIIAGMP